MLVVPVVQFAAKSTQKTAMYFASEMDRKWRPSNKNRNVIGQTLFIHGSVRPQCLSLEASGLLLAFHVQCVYRSVSHLSQNYTSCSCAGWATAESCGYRCDAIGSFCCLLTIVIFLSTMAMPAAGAIVLRSVTVTAPGLVDNVMFFVCYFITC